MHGHWKTLSDKVMKEQERSGRKEEERTTSFEERATFHRMRTRSILYDPEGNDNQSVVSANVYFGSDDESACGTETAVPRRHGKIPRSKIDHVRSVSTIVCCP